MSVQPGTSIGRYHIVEQLGQGGMATVYKAYDTRLERYVAIKFIRRSAIGEEHVEKLNKRFEREAKALAKFSHANIVKVYDFGEFEGSPYLVMEYVAGGTLKARTGKPMPYWQAASLLLPVARALEYAHKRGIIHRDVKPVNILLDDEGQPMLSDFGISKVLEEGESTLTGTGVGIGTPEYMAPEQGAGHEVDHRVDIYALGIVLYEFITGRKPYTADTPLATVLKHMTEPLPPARDVIPDLPTDVEAILFKALAKDAAERYQDMTTFSAALEGISKPREVSQTITYAEPLSQTGTATPATLKPPLVESAPAAAEDVRRVVSVPAHPSVPIPRVKPAAGKHRSKREQVFLIILGIIAFIGVCIVGAGVFFFNFSIGAYRAGSDYFYFTSSREGKMEIFRQKIPGVAEKATFLGERAEAWGASPGGKFVYFTSNLTGKQEIFRVDNEGTEEQVTHSAGRDESWEVNAAENSTVYFTSNRSGKPEIYRMGFQGIIEQVTHTPGKGHSFEPAKAPDGCLYFTSNRSGKRDIYRICQADVERVTHSVDGAESWQASPASRGRIYFTSTRSGKREVFSLDPYGNVEQVTHTPGRAESWQPRVGPFGYLFFTSNRDGKQEVYYMKKDGDIQPLTQTTQTGQSAVTYIE